MISGDFGCSRKLHWDDDDVRASATHRSHVTGTVAYRAPELFRGLSPTPAADIYAFGIFLWQMLSQKHPYIGKVSERRTEFF